MHYDVTLLTTPIGVWMLNYPVYITETSHDFIVVYTYLFNIEDIRIKQSVTINCLHNGDVLYMCLNAIG